MAKIDMSKKDLNKLLERCGIDPEEATQKDIQKCLRKMSIK